MAETYQEANTLAYDIVNVSVTTKVAVEQHAEISNAWALLDGPATDPHADRGDVAGILSGA